MQLSILRDYINKIYYSIINFISSIIDHSNDTIKFEQFRIEMLKIKGNKNRKLNIYNRKKKEEKMGDKGLDFKHKEVVNIKDGKRLGYVQDVCADLESGTITSIIVPGNNKILNIFSQNNDIVIPWKNIKCIGDDLILVEI